jgi:hypothetical protein
MSRSKLRGDSDNRMKKNNEYTKPQTTILSCNSCNNALNQLTTMHLSTIISITPLNQLPLNVNQHVKVQQSVSVKDLYIVCVCMCMWMCVYVCVCMCVCGCVWMCVYVCVESHCVGWVSSSNSCYCRCRRTCRGRNRSQCSTDTMVGHYLFSRLETIRITRFSLVVSNSPLNHYKSINSCFTIIMIIL